VTYHPPDLLPPEREDVVSGSLDAAEVDGVSVVAPVVTVWVRVVQLLDGRLHRTPARAELSGARCAGSADQRRRLADALRLDGARVMMTLWATGCQTRELAWARRFEAVSESADPGRVWGRFIVELASREAAPALARWAAKAG